MARDLVTICIPTFNRGKFLPLALESAASQTYTNIEILVTDNHSTDDTPEIMRSYSGKDPRISYHRHAHNLGMVGNFNSGLRLAQGSLVKILCDDDLLAPDCIEKCVNVFQEFPDITLVACSRQIMDEDLRPLRVQGFSDDFVHMQGTKVIQRCLFNGNLIGEPAAVLFRRSAATRGFLENYSQLMDLEMWFHALEKGNFAFLPEPLCSFRSHGGQYTLQNMLHLRAARDEIRIYLDYGKKEYLDLPFRKRRELILKRLHFCLHSIRIPINVFHRSPVRKGNFPDT
jgi:glycosyltransferase involved in cell wall biosynthesis